MDYNATILLMGQVDRMCESLQRLARIGYSNVRDLHMVHCVHSHTLGIGCCCTGGRYGELGVSQLSSLYH